MKQNEGAGTLNFIELETTHVGEFAVDFIDIVMI